MSILVGGGGKKGAAGVERVGLEEPRTGLLGQFPGHLTEKTGKCIFFGSMHLSQSLISMTHTARNYNCT